LSHCPRAPGLILGGDDVDLSDLPSLLIAIASNLTSPRCFRLSGISLAAPLFSGTVALML